MGFWPSDSNSFRSNHIGAPNLLPPLILQYNNKTNKAEFNPETNTEENLRKSHLP